MIGKIKKTFSELRKRDDYEKIQINIFQWTVIIVLVIVFISIGVALWFVLSGKQEPKYVNIIEFGIYNADYYYIYSHTDDGGLKLNADITIEDTTIYYLPAGEQNYAVLEYYNSGFLYSAKIYITEDTTIEKPKDNLNLN
jgi:hypothetical protein